VPCLDGCCLASDGHEKFYRPVEWMQYLIQHFLMPGAAASCIGLPMFEHFTFDHRLDGLVVGCRRDTKELFAIEVLNNEVTSASSAPAYQRPGESPFATRRRSTAGPPRAGVAGGSNRTCPRRGWSTSRPGGPLSETV
jgi:hypothetical protein